MRISNCTDNVLCKCVECKIQLKELEVTGCIFDGTVIVKGYCEGCGQFRRNLLCDIIKKVPDQVLKDEVKRRKKLKHEQEIHVDRS